MTEFFHETASISLAPISSFPQAVSIPLQDELSNSGFATTLLKMYNASLLCMEEISILANKTDCRTIANVLVN